MLQSRHGKYAEGGKIAYFPKEHVIRLIGPDCFKAINEHKHREAEDRFRTDMARLRHMDFLLSCLPHLPRAIAAIEDNISIAAAVDMAREVLPDLIKAELGVDLWELIRTGALKVTEEHQQTYRRRDQSEGTRTLRTERTFSTIEGYKLLRPRARRTVLAYQQALQAFKAIPIGEDLRTSVRSMSDEERRATARLVSQGIRRAIWATHEIMDVRQFISSISIANLKGWGQHPGSPVRMHIAVDGRNLYVGKTSSIYRRFEFPDVFFSRPRELPDLIAYETRVA